MAFNTEKFMGTKFVPRNDEIPVPDLADFFDDAEPVWKVRGLTGVELGRIEEAVSRNRNIAAILEGLVQPGTKEKVESVRELFGIGDKTPDDTAKRIEMIMLGSIEPVVDLDLALRICKAFPAEFYLITQKITEITGMGHVPGKPKPSGNNRK